MFWKRAVGNDLESILESFWVSFWEHLAAKMLKKCISRRS